MEGENRELQQFYAALSHVVTEKGWGFQTVLSSETHLSEGYISQIIDQKRSPSMGAQVKIAKACGYRYVEFLQLGEGILETGEGPAKARKSPPGEPSWMSEALIKSLQSNIDALTDRVNALKNYTESQEQRLIEQEKQIGVITAALIQAEKQKDFLPLKALTGGV